MSDLIQQNNQLQSANLEAEIDSLRNVIMPGASDADLKVFAKFCAKTQLDPFSRQIYAIQRGGKWGYQTSIDGFRVVAQRSGLYEGQTPSYWCGNDGKWVDVWLEQTPPAAAKIGVYRKGHREPIWAVAKFTSYAQPNNPIWKKMPDLMLSKCAESLALRKAFPNDLSGLYTSEEMDQIEENEKIKNPASNYKSNQSMPLITERQINELEALREMAKVPKDEFVGFLKTQKIEKLSEMPINLYTSLKERFESKVDQIKKEKEEQKNKKPSFTIGG